jgi:hypothetical protein
MSYFRRQYIFPGQQAGEQIFLVIRQHWVILAGRMLFALMFAAIYIGLNIFLNSNFPEFMSQYSSAIGIAQDIYLMFLLLGIFMAFVIYYLNVQIVTNKRVVDITQNGLLSHTVSELELSHIEDVTTEVKGLLPTMLNFGDVYIQTAAEKERFVFGSIAKPADVQKLILDLYEKLPKNS